MFFVYFQPGNISFPEGAQKRTAVQQNDSFSLKKRTIIGFRSLLTFVLRC